MLARHRFALSGLTVATITAVAIASSQAAAGDPSAWPAAWPAHVAWLVGAGLAWAAALALVGRGSCARGDRAVIVVVALLLRVPAWLAAPTHSDDVYRYAWDGRVSLAGVNPYRHAPADPALADLAARSPRSAAMTTIRARVNHPELATIYPPASQLLFLVAAALPLPQIASLKLVLAGCDLALLFVLLSLLRRRGGDPRWAIAWGWSPLVAVEIGQNAHLDALPLLGLAAALWAWERARPSLTGLWLGLAIASKGIAAPLLFAFRSRRAAAAAVLVCLACALPFAGAGAAMVGSTGEFARRWRANDGAYALLQAAAERVTCRALGEPISDGAMCRRPLDLWPRAGLATLISGRSDRAAVYPDEIAAFAARALVALLLAAWVARTLLSAPPPEVAIERVLGALLLLTPALHPWYALWLLPSVALSRRPAWIALAALVPLGYLPMAAFRAGGPWHDAIAPRLVEHGACWALLAGEAWLLARRRRARGKVDRPEEQATIPAGRAASGPGPV